MNRAIFGTTAEPTAPALAYLGLGSNLGDREAALREAVVRLNRHPRIAVVAHSDLYETAPVGPIEQGDFLNMVAAVRTDLTPEDLLDAALEVEAGLGRVRTMRWGPRTIDVDVLLYENIACSTPKLTVPHPHMAERAFVLVPLLDVMREMRRPEAEWWADQLAKLEGKETVKRWKSIRWLDGSEPSGS